MTPGCAELRARPRTQAARQHKQQIVSHDQFEKTEHIELVHPGRVSNEEGNANESANAITGGREEQP